MRMIWLTGVETSEPLGIPVSRVTLVERKPARDGHVVAIFLDTGKEIRVMEPLQDVRAALEGGSAGRKGFT